MTSSGFSPSSPLSEHGFPSRCVCHQAGSPSDVPLAAPGVHSATPVKRERERELLFPIHSIKGPTFHFIKPVQMFIEHLLCAEPFPQFHLYNNPAKWGPLLSLLYRWGHLGTPIRIQAEEQGWPGHLPGWQPGRASSPGLGGDWGPEWELGQSRSRPWRTALLWTQPDMRPRELRDGLPQTASVSERAGVRTDMYTHAHMLVTTVRTRVDPGFIMGV